MVVPLLKMTTSFEKCPLFYVTSGPEVPFLFVNLSLQPASTCPKIYGLAINHEEELIWKYILMVFFHLLVRLNEDISYHLHTLEPNVTVNSNAPKTGTYRKCNRIRVSVTSDKVAFGVEIFHTE